MMERFFSPPRGEYTGDSAINKRQERWLSAWVSFLFSRHSGKTPIDHPDGSVTGEKLANHSVSEGKIASGAVSARCLAPGSVTDEAIGARTIEDAAAQSGSFLGTLSQLLNRFSLSLRAHRGDHQNPHAVTKAQVGLGNAENTADADKPLSGAAIDALAKKVDQLDATVSAAADKIPRAGGDGKIAAGWIPALGSRYAQIRDMRGGETNDLNDPDFFQTGIYRVYADGPEGEGNYILFVLAMETGYIAIQTISKNAGGECNAYQRRVENIIEPLATPWRKIIVNGGAELELNPLTGGVALGEGAGAFSGLAAGKNAAAYSGVALGQGASADDGVSLGFSAKTDGGVSLGAGADTRDMGNAVALGPNSKALRWGEAVHNIGGETSQRNLYSTVGWRGICDIGVLPLSGVSGQTFILRSNSAVLFRLSIVAISDTKALALEITGAAKRAGMGDAVLIGEPIWKTIAEDSGTQYWSVNPFANGTGIYIGVSTGGDDAATWTVRGEITEVRI